MVTVSVPATTANIGPGFDCFGCALNLRASFAFETAEQTAVTGCPPQYANENNLVLRALRFAAQRMGIFLPPVKLTIASPIPPERGLGSSAALIVAGVAAAGVFSGQALSKETMLDMATAMEGHPDNVSPAILGGLRLSFMEGDSVVSVPAPVHPSLKFLALVPGFSLSTAKARAVLPAQINRADAVHNIGRAAVLVKALETGDMGLIALALSDRIHQPCRFPLIPNADDVRKAASALGCDAFFLSGAGPAMMCVYRDERFEKAMAENIKAIPGNWQAMALEVDREGVIVTEASAQVSCSNDRKMQSV